MLRKSSLILTAGIALLVTRGADAGPAFTYSANAGGNPGGTQSLGFDFKATSAITVTSLGAYAASSTSLSAGQVVEIYDLNTGTIVTQATITSNITNTFNYASVAPVTLNTNDTYSIFSTFLANTGAQYGTGTITFDPSVANMPISGSNTGFGNPGQPPSQPFPNILAVNFQFSPAAVPEPASIALMGLGLAGVALARRATTRRVA